MSSRGSTVGSRICQGLAFLSISLTITGLIYQWAYISVKNDLARSQSMHTQAGYFRFINSSSPISIITTSLTGLLKDVNLNQTSQFLPWFVDQADSLSEQQVPDQNGPSLRGPQSNAVVLSADMISNQVNSLKARSSNFLQWARTMNKDVSSWNKVANSEVHLVHLLHKFLGKVQNHLKAETRGPIFGGQTIEEIVSKGYQCSAVQAQQQEIISSKISMDICSEIEWYKLLQLAWPEASSFMDIGANKGYLGSLFVALWGENKNDVTPAEVFDISKRAKTWATSRNPAGYCKDGYNHGIPLYCSSGKRDPRSGHCVDTSADRAVRVVSVDGSSYLTNTLNHVIATEFKDPAVKQGSVWKYHNFAMSDKQGSVRFTKQTKETNPGFEGNRILVVSVL